MEICPFALVGLDGEPDGAEFMIARMESFCHLAGSQLGVGRHGG